MTQQKVGAWASQFEALGFRSLGPVLDDSMPARYTPPAFGVPSILTPTITVAYDDEGCVWQADGDRSADLEAIGCVRMTETMGTRSEAGAIFS